MKKVYITEGEITVEEYATVEGGIAAEMAAGELSAAFYSEGKLWVLSRVTPYGATALVSQGQTQFAHDIVGLTIGFSESPIVEADLI